VPKSFSPELLERLVAHTEVVSYRKGRRIIAEGAPNETIYFIRRGFVRVEHSGRVGVGLVLLGPGEVFGEMASLEALPTSASVIADEDVEVLALGKSRLTALLGSDPALAARVFEVLAVMLAGKLRRTTERLIRSCPPAMIALGPPRQTIPSGLSDGDLPYDLQDALDSFEMDVLKVEQRLKFRDFTEAHAQSTVDLACDTLCSLLDHPPPPGTPWAASRPGKTGGGGDPATWRAIVGDFIFRRTFPLFLLSGTIRRCYRKPRGAAVDFEMRERIDRDEAEGNGVLGPFLDRWFLSTAVCRSFRSSRQLMATLLFGFATRDRAEGPVRVTSLANGTAREIIETINRGGPLGPEILATCIDVDHDALRRGMDLAQEAGCRERFRYFQCHPVYLARGQERIALPPQDVIIAPNLAESIDDDAVVALLDWCHDQLAQGGSVILTNLDPPPALRAFMEHVLEWRIYPRDEGRLGALFGRSRLGDRALSFRRDASGANVFAVKGQVSPLADPPRGNWTGAPSAPDNRTA